MITVTCFNCGTVFDIKPAREKKSKGYFFCSKDCEGEFRTADNNVVCAICNTGFHVKPKRLKRLKNPEHICCSKECSNKLKERTYLGDNNSQFGLKGELNSSHESDYKIDHGYISVRNYAHPFSYKTGYIRLHRIIMEEYLRNFEPESDFLVSVEGCDFKLLSPDVIIHHRNENRLDNTIENLQILDLSEHNALHSNLNSKNIVRDVLGRFIERPQKYKSDKIDDQLIKKHIQDAGLDIKSSEDVTIKAGKSVLIKTGLYAEIPDNHVGLVWSRSGLSVKHNLEVGAGCIDASYRGELRVHLLNFGENDYDV